MTESRAYDLLRSTDYARELNPGLEEEYQKLLIVLGVHRIATPTDMVDAMLGNWEEWTRPEFVTLTVPSDWGGWRIRGWRWKEGELVWFFPYLPLEKCSPKHAYLMGALDAVRDGHEFECPHLDCEAGPPSLRRTYRAPGDFSPVLVCKACGQVLQEDNRPF